MSLTPLRPPRTSTLFPYTTLFRSNVANREGHIRTTGPEIWDQTDGKVDGFICAVGTGGTLAGVGIALKERNPKIAIGLAEDRKSTRLNSSHLVISYAVFCLKKKKT